MTDRSVVYSVIDGERIFQDHLWTGGPQSIGEELLLIEQYVAAGRETWAAEAAPEIRTLHVIRKICAIAVRCMENHGAPPREETANA